MNNAALRIGLHPEVADQVEQCIADGHPQDPDDDSRYISPEGILSQTTEEDLTHGRSCGRPRSR